MFGTLFPSEALLASDFGCRLASGLGLSVADSAARGISMGVPNVRLFGFKV